MRVFLQGRLGESDKSFLHVLEGGDHTPDVLRGQAHAPGIGKRPAGLFREFPQMGVRKCDHFLLFLLAVGDEGELDVHGVGVTDRDRVLQPLELDVPYAPERIRAGIETADVCNHHPHSNRRREAGARFLRRDRYHGGYFSSRDRCATRPNQRNSD